MPYKDYNQNELMLLPPSLLDLIAEKDLVKVINNFVDELPKSAVEDKYNNKTGCPSFHPRMMLKVLIYAYTQNIYSCRQIAKAIRENICFMWLSGMQRPDFNTVNRFRSVYLEDCLELIFSSLVEFLLKNKYIKGEDYFIDGTKLEADASKNSHVWKKNVERYREKIQSRAKEIFDNIRQINIDEDKKYGGHDLPETGEGSSLTSEDIKKAAKSLGEDIKNTENEEEKKALSKAVKTLEKDAEKLEKYEEQEKILNGRNSYSKTDKDATFMRMKGTDELRAGYNIQAGTENNFVIGFSIGQNANDASLLKSHLSERKETGLPVPKNIMGDAVYGTEENYEYLESEEITSYLKYPHWYREIKHQISIYDKSNFKYDKATDTFKCPEGRVMRHVENAEQKTKSGYTTNVRKYECENCSDCPVKDKCKKTEKNRRIDVNEKLNGYLENARSNLCTDKGIELRKRRGPEIETVFGELKHNKHYKRLRLRGLKKGHTELSWLFLGYNLKKISIIENQKNSPNPDNKAKKGLKKGVLRDKIVKFFVKILNFSKSNFCPQFFPAGFQKIA